MTKYRRYQYGVPQINSLVFVHLRNSNKQHLILAKFYINYAPLIGSQSAKC